MGQKEIINSTFSQLFYPFEYTKIAFLNMIKVLKPNQKGALFMYKNYDIDQFIKKNKRHLGDYQVF